MLDKHIILGVHVRNRTQKASEVQEILSQYGCNIKTRLGLHEVDENYCAAAGVVLLEAVGEDAVINEMADKLNALDGIEVQKMVFEHD